MFRDPENEGVGVGGGGVVGVGMGGGVSGVVGRGGGLITHASFFLEAINATKSGFLARPAARNPKILGCRQR